MVAKHRRKTAKKALSRSTSRASWRGQLQFGLVSFEVQAVNAENKVRGEFHFHLLHRPDHERIHYAKMCPKHGEVANDEIVEGYEYAKGQYVEFDKDELDALRSDRERALSIDAFVGSDEIDPIYFDGRMYYLLPSGAGAGEPYALLEAAMEHKRRWAVGQVVFSGREQLAVVRPLRGVLTMAMLRYDAEVRKPAEIKRDLKPVRTDARKLHLAEQLIGEAEPDRFDFSQYQDRYRQTVQHAIEARRKGEKLKPPKEARPEVINLMDALKQSVARAGHRAKSVSDGRKPPAARHKRSTAHRRRA